MEFEIQKQNYIMFYLHKYKKNRISITLSGESTLADIYEISKTRMFTKWQYYRRTSGKTMDEIMEDVKSQIIHDIFVSDSECKEILSLPNDNKKTIREFINENEIFFTKSASYFKKIYNLFVVDEYGVRDMLAQQNNINTLDSVTTLAYYTKCLVR